MPHLKLSYILKILGLSIFIGASFHTWALATNVIGTTSVVSVSNNGSLSNGISHAPALSGDGRYVVFLSDATNLVPSDENDILDVFVHDRYTRQTSLVSVSSQGDQGDGEPSRPSISSDGRYVVFSSDATNLIPGDVNGTSDVFLHDRYKRETELISISSNGEQGNTNSFTRRPSISADGRYVVFFSNSSNLVMEDTNEASDVFIHDRQSGETILISRSLSGEPANSDSVYPTISADGHYIAFHSDASNLVAGDTNEVSDVFLHKLDTGETRRVSVSSTRVQGNRESDLSAISADGRYVAFSSFASNLVPSDTNNTADIFIHDQITGQTSRVSINSSGDQAHSLSDVPSLSADGRYIAFYSYADNLVVDDTNSFTDVFRHDSQTGETIRISVNSTNEQSNYDSLCSAISSDGQVLAFYSYANNLVPGDTNNQPDVFVHSFAPEISIKSNYFPMIFH
jgi:Tol biopolymer transport system component